MKTSRNFYVSSFSRRVLFAFGLATALGLVMPFASAGEIERREEKNVPYSPDTADGDAYRKSQCLLDISAPKNATGLPVLVWFHGGGLSAGSKEYPKALLGDRIVLIGVGYRLSPKADFPAFLEDAAAAVAWTFANVDKYGGDPRKIFVGGHSAGAYLSAMVGLDPRWLKPHGIERSRIAGLIPLSGQVTTHFNVRKMLKYPQPEYLPIVDENAPLHHLSKEAPPTLLILGDRKIEWPARVEENEFLAATLRAMKHPHVEFHENAGFDHGSVAAAPATYEQIRRFIEKVCGTKID